MLTAYNNGTITADCLAVARLIICANSFPRCSNGNKSHPICTHLCDFYWNRCPGVRSHFLVSLEHNECMQ